MNFQIHIKIKFQIGFRPSNLQTRASAEKFTGRRTEKTRPKNSSIKPLSTLAVSVWKSRGARPAYRRPRLQNRPKIWIDQS